MLKIKNLMKSYQNKQILNNVSFTINPGEIGVFLGKSGVGKSTILRIISGLESKENGSIIFNDNPLSFQDVGIVFQDFNLFPHLTVQENITLPLQKIAKMSDSESIEIAQKLLTLYELTALANLYPQDLSGGQKQRVAFARTLAMQPKIICLDEPTSALDPILTNKIASAINNLAKQGLIVILATHDTELIKQLHGTIYLMDQGKIIEQASSDELSKNLDQFPSIKNFTQGGNSDANYNKNLK